MAIISLKFMFCKELFNMKYTFRENPEGTQKPLDTPNCHNGNTETKFVSGEQQNKQWIFYAYGIQIRYPDLIYCSVILSVQID